MKNVNDYTYYVVVEPRYQDDFRPSVLDYGLTFEAATNVMCSYINERGLKFKETASITPVISTSREASLTNFRQATVCLSEELGDRKSMKQDLTENKTYTNDLTGSMRYINRFER